MLMDISVLGPLTKLYAMLMSWYVVAGQWRAAC